MTDKDDRKITLANQAISTAIDDKVNQRIADITSNQGTFTEYTDFLEAVKTVDDPKLRASLLTKYAKVIDENQKVRNEALKALSESEIELRKDRAKTEKEIEERVVNAELEKNDLRVRLFSDRLIILFFMCFPIIVAIGLVVSIEAYFFAFVVMVMWYGMSLALYFSQATALGDLVKVFKSRNKSKDKSKNESSDN